jgi:hypothetical protein
MSQILPESASLAQLAALEEPGLAHHLDTSLLTAMAAACGAFVASIYGHQPILELLQQTFPRPFIKLNIPEGTT